MSTPASSACDRCGAFASLERRGTRSLCADCRLRLRHPIESIQSSPVTVAAVLQGTFQLLAALGPVPWLITGTMAAIQSGMLAIVEPIAPRAAVYIVSVAAGLLGIPAVAAITQAARQLLDLEEQLDWESALRVGLKSWLPLLATRLIAGLLCVLWTLALIVPGILRLLSYSLIDPMVVRGEAAGWEALELSRARMAGHRGQAFIAAAALLAPSIILGAVWGGLHGPAVRGRPLVPPWPLHIPSQTYAMLMTTLCHVVLDAKLLRGAPAREVQTLQSLDLSGPESEPAPLALQPPPASPRSALPDEREGGGPPGEPTRPS